LLIKGVEIDMLTSDAFCLTSLGFADRVILRTRDVCYLASKMTFGFGARLERRIDVDVDGAIFLW
jgi:hypothetical protein